MILTIVLLSLIVVLLGYATYINYKRYRKAVEYAENSFFIYNSFIIKTYTKFQDTLNAMKAADARGSFQADDEVGVTFDYLKEQISDLDQFIRKYVESQEETR